jgi:hypothetical protein
MLVAVYGARAQTGVDNGSPGRTMTREKECHEFNCNVDDPRDRCRT